MCICILFCQALWWKHQVLAYQFRYEYCPHIVSLCSISSLFHTGLLQPSITISTQKSFEAQAASQRLNEHNPALNNENMNEHGQRYTTTCAVDHLSEFCIIERPWSRDLDVPALDFFPVSHIILNNVDWSLTVVNIGLCVMIYSYQLSMPDTDIKVCACTYMHMVLTAAHLWYT